MKKFEGQAKKQKKALWDIIHTWHITIGTSRFIEIVKGKGYPDNTRLLTEDEMCLLEPPSSEGEEEGARGR